MLKLNELFHAEYGHQLDLNKMDLVPEDDPQAIAFVGRTRSNNGVVGYVRELIDIAPGRRGAITVALGGSVLSAFLQPRPFYTAQNVAVLVPRQELNENELLFYCYCIRANRFRYSTYGREANRTYREIEVPSPDRIPDWVYSYTIEQHESIREPVSCHSLKEISVERWKWFTFDQLFEIRKGKRLTKADMTEGSTPFIGASSSNNGVTAFVGQLPIHPGNVITVTYNGAVGEAFYQSVPFWCSDDVNVLYPRFKLNPYIAMFLCAVIRMEKYRFSYGRKWHLERMKASQIRLPVADNGEPDWEYMEDYIKSIPLSSQVAED
jgi:hypothetical protein